jgi:excisionase family DNA binding protein
MLLRVNDAAQRLCVLAGTIYALCERGRLPHSRIGVGRGTIRIDEEDLAKYLNSAKAASRRTKPGRWAARDQYSASEETQKAGHFGQ